MRSTLILPVLTLLLAPAQAQSSLTTNTLQLDDPSNMAAAMIDDVAWMAGHWQGPFHGGHAEEVWAPPSGKSMVGMFKLVREGAVSMYEIMTLVEESGSVILKLKHFEADLTGWEEKDDHVAFPLVRLAENAAYFDGLTFKRLDARTLQGYLAMRGVDGVTEVPFTYQLVE